MFQRALANETVAFSRYGMRIGGYVYWPFGIIYIEANGHGWFMALSPSLDRALLKNNPSPYRKGFFLCTEYDWQARAFDE